MAPQACVRRPALLLALILASTATPALAGDPSPRRQAELDAVVARRHSVRQAQAVAGARRRAEVARQVESVLSYELAMAQSNARYQMATAQSARNWTSRDADYRQNTQPFYAASPVVIYPPYSTGWTSVTPHFGFMGSSSTPAGVSSPNASLGATIHEAGHPAHHGAQHH